VSVSTSLTAFTTAVKGTPEFLREVRKELEKVTWPDREQLRQATITIIAFVLLIGAFIAIMDVTLQAVLVKGIPSLFGA
jgi:preprotein translocase subunit SecE